MLHLRALGELRLSSADGELLAGRRKELVLLAYLAVRSPRAVRREELIGLFWDDRDQTHARQSLRQALLRLRRTIGEALLVTRDTVQLAGGALELDALAFTADVSAGRAREAVARWGGEFAPGAEDAGGEAYRAWLEAEREALRRRLSTAFEQLVDSAVDAGDWTEAASWAEQWTELLPLEEQAQRRCIEVLHHAGRTAEAGSRHAAYIARLRRELGSEASDDFKGLLKQLDAGERRAGTAVRGSPGSAALFTPDLVGRDAAWRELAAAWDEVRGGGCVTIVVEGAEGLGKTLLCERFLRSIEGDAAPLLVLRARAHDDERDHAWSSARNLLAGLLHAPGLGGASDRALAEISRLVPPIRDRYRNLPDPSGDERKLSDAVAEVLATVAQEVPLALFLDDLPGADPASRELVLDIARSALPGILLLVSARPDGVAPAGKSGELGQVPGVRRLKLRPLDVAEIEILLRSMIALPHNECQTLAPRLHSESGGNPFYAAEIVSAMVDEGLLTATARGVWHIDSAHEGRPLPLPSSISDALGRRLARLNDDAQRVARAAASLNEPFRREQLKLQAALPADRFDAALDTLIGRRLVRPVPARGDADDTLEFAHPMVRRVTRERIGTVRSAGRRKNSLAGSARWVTALAAVSVAIFLAWRGRTPPTADPIRLAVLPLENRTGETALNEWGEYAGEQLTRWVDLAGAIPVIAASTVRDAIRASGLASPSAADVARRTGATHVVTGRMARANGSIRLDIEFIDARKPVRLLSPEPVYGPAGSLETAIEQLAESTAAASLALFEPRPDWMAGYTLPSTIGMYRDYLATFQLFCQTRFAEVVAKGNGVLQQSPEFVPVMGLVRIAYWNLGRTTDADSVHRRLEQLRNRMTRSERAEHDWMGGLMDGDTAQAARSAEEMFRMDPTSKYGYAAGFTAFRMRRLEAALERFRAVDLDLPCQSAWFPWWNYTGSAYHMLGRYEEERDLAHRGAARFADHPGLYAMELRVAAAHGRLGTIDSLLAHVAQLPPPAGPAIGTLAISAGLELRVHGYTDAAERFIKQGTDWFEAQPPSVMRSERGRAFLAARRWADADTVFAGVIRDATALDNPGYSRDLGDRGVALAHLGRQVEARELSQRLERIPGRPVLTSYGTAARAAIAAALGDSDGAIRLLNDAFQHGYPYDISIHQSPWWEPLLNEPAFKALVRPR